jgi:methionyl-tRNA formyltransferase
VTRLKLIFAGTPEFARVALAQLHQAGHDITLVLTQPDRPAGRGMKLQASVVKQFAQSHGLPVAQPRSLRLDGKYPADAAAAHEAIAAAQADAMVVAAYGLILPQWALDMPRLGCLNIHASLLPRWRGAAPIHRAIEAGDAQTGITIMQMDAGLDTGDMLLTQAMPILPQHSTATLHDLLADMGGHMIVRALALAACGQLRPVAQPAAGVSYAAKIEKAESTIDWAQPVAQIERRIRAFDPFPGGSTQLVGGAADIIKLWHAVVDTSAPLPQGAQPGQVLFADAQGIGVVCGDGVLRLTELQRPGGKRLAAGDFLRGFPLSPPAVFASAAG